MNLRRADNMHLSKNLSHPHKMPLTNHLHYIAQDLRGFLRGCPERSEEILLGCALSGARKCPWGIQVPSLRPRRIKGRYASTFLYKKAIRPLPCFSSFTKSHARLVCSVASALTTPHCRYQLFVSLC